MSRVGLEALRAALARNPAREHPALPGRSNHLRAGVLVPVRWGQGPEVLLTLRTAGLRRHAGEICFPGGRPDPDDADLEATARREAREELGIEAGPLLGRLSSTPLYTSDYRLEPFVAEVAPEAPLRPEPGEVARVLRLALDEVLARPELDAIPWEFRGQVHLSPVFRVEGEWMFGGTAHVFHELLGCWAAAVGRPLPPLVTGRLGWGDLLGPDAW